MQRAICLFGVAVLLVVPTASADHIDDEGDTVEVEVVNDVLPTTADDRCTELRPYGFLGGPHVTTPYAYDGVCDWLGQAGTFHLQVHTAQGDPVPFTWDLSFPPYLGCGPAQDAVGSTTISTLHGGDNCPRLTLEVRGTVHQAMVSIERLDTIERDG